MRTRGSGERRRRRTLLGEVEEDPLSGIANLFDAAMVFAVALLIAFVAHTGAPFPGNPSRNQVLPKKKLKSLKRFRPASRTARGKGRRLGVAYRLDSGEVVYIPEPGDQK